MQLGELENLNGLDLTSVSTEYPVLASGISPFDIKTAAITDTKDKKGKLLVCELELSVPRMDKNGKEVQPGYKLTHRIGLTPSEKRTNEMILRDIARLLDGVFGEVIRRQINFATFNIEALINQPVVVKHGIDAATDEYPEQTRIKEFVKKAA